MTTIAAAHSIQPCELAKLYRDKGPGGLSILDVRTPAEHRNCHLDGSLLIPLDGLSDTAIENLGGGEEPLYVLCHSGKRAAQAIEKLERAGNYNTVLVEGGILACEKEQDLPIVLGKKTIPLERQVRIAAGALVAVGSLLAWIVNPAWLVLPAFVGCGLVFAGITDTCAMGMLIAKMPWNR